MSVFDPVGTAALVASRGAGPSVLRGTGPSASHGTGTSVSYGAEPSTLRWAGPSALRGTAPIAPRGTGPLTTASGTDFDMFLKMLTAQIRNQDPLEPMDSADYAVQLATFSGVEQQVRTNDLLAELAGVSGEGALSRIAAWVGREVRAPVAARFDGAPIPLEFALRAGAEAGELIVTGADGAVVDRRPVAARIDEALWDGVVDGAVLPPGRYGFALSSLAGGEEIGRDTVETYGLVREVRVGPEGPVLWLEGGAEIAPGMVSALREVV